MSGTTIAQIIPFFISPILTRLYAPEDFALLAIYVSITSLFAIIATGQYESAIVLPKSDLDAVNIVALSLLITISVSSISLILVSFFNLPITNLTGNRGIAPWLYLVPVSVFLAGTFNTLTYWAIRKKQFKRVAYRTVSQAVTQASVKLTCGFANYLKGGLIVGTISGRIVATSVLAHLTWKDDRKQIHNIAWSNIKKNALYYINFPKYTTLHGFLDIVNSTSLIIIISRFYGDTTLGLYSFAFGILSRPLQIISSSFSQVFYEKASKLEYTNNNLWKFSKKIISRLFFIGLPIFVLVVFMGPKLFLFVFGKDWFEAGQMAQILTIWLYPRFILSPITVLPQIKNKQKQFIYYSFMLNIIVPILFFVLVYLNYNFKVSLIVISSVTFAIYLLVFLFIRSITKTYERS